MASLSLPGFLWLKALVFPKTANLSPPSLGQFQSSIFLNCPTPPVVKLFCMALRDSFPIPPGPHVHPKLRAWLKSSGISGGNFASHGATEPFPLPSGDSGQPGRITHPFDGWPPFRLWPNRRSGFHGSKVFEKEMLRTSSFNSRQRPTLSGINTPLGTDASYLPHPAWWDWIVPLPSSFMFWPLWQKFRRKISCNEWSRGQSAGMPACFAPPASGCWESHSHHLTSAPIWHGKAYCRFTGISAGGRRTPVAIALCRTF